jgi:phosphoglycolate phosphatase-like HAD superfamily hydrolase
VEKMTEYLLSWNDTPAKGAILDFVAAVTNESGPDYVPPEERIAVFDNDGTLWCEKPYVQMDFIMRRLTAMAEKDASLRKIQPWKMAYEKEFSWANDAIIEHYNGDDSKVKLLGGGILKAFSDMTVEEFTARVVDFFDSARHPAYDCSYLEVAYQPMVELLIFLEANSFTTYIVSGGGRDFMRPITQQVYGIPPERVIGSAPTLSFKTGNQGAHIMRQAGMDIFDDGPAKPVYIWDRIGRRPILAAGNANGDTPMLQFAGGKDHPALRLLVNHDDAARETNYTAGAEQAIKLAKEQSWTVISMKKDWKNVFAFQSK